MHADTKVGYLGQARATHLSAAGCRALIEAAVRVGDVTIVACAGIAAAAWRFSDAPSAAPFLGYIVLGSFLAANVFSLFGLYDIERLRNVSWQLPRLLTAWTVVLMSLTALMFALKTAHEVSRLWVAVWFFSGVACLAVSRIVLRMGLAWAGSSGSIARRVALVGTGEHVGRAYRRLSTGDKFLTVAAVLDLEGYGAGGTSGLRRLSSITELERLIYAGAIDYVVLALPAHSEGFFESSLRRLRHLPIDVGWLAELPVSHLPVLGVTALAGTPLVHLVERPIDGWRYLVKTVEDRVLAGLALLLAAPLMGLIALAIKLDSPGPVLYRQRRRGFSREPIVMLKFRTMHPEACDAVDAAAVRQVTRDDPRVTRVGRILRRTSLDELPQLVNVLRGEMSLVGPRPHAVAHDDYYQDVIDDYLGRHRVKPGITGWAQVNGCRGETRTVDDMRKRIELDVEYIDNWSIWLDLRILCRTVLVGFRDSNAY